MCVGIFAHTYHACLFECVAIVGVEFETVTVTLAYSGGAIGLGDMRSFCKMAVVGAQTHGATHVVHAFLFFHQVDDSMRGSGVHLRTVGFGQSEYVAGEFYHHALHSETDAECGEVVLPAVAQSHKFALYAALSEPWGYDYAIHPPELVGHIGFGELL